MSQMPHKAQPPTRQRASQRLMSVLIPSLVRVGHALCLWDIAPAYLLSEATLTRDIFATALKDRRVRSPQYTLVSVRRPLDDIAGAGVQGVAAYQNQHLQKRKITTST